MVKTVDPTTLETAGEAVPVADRVHFNLYRYTGSYTLAPGLLLYRSADERPTSRLTWLDLDGTELGVIGEPAQFEHVRISPDGRRAACAVRDAQSRLELWMVDLARGSASRFTLGADAGGFPIWSPDGRNVAYADGSGKAFVKDTAGAGEPRTLCSERGRAILTSSWSPDGTTIATFLQGPQAGFDIAMVPAEGGDPVPVLRGPGNEGSASFSPDGRWISYISDETGRNELYVVSYPGAGGKWQVSTGGAVEGDWLGAREIAWFTEAGELFAAEVGASGGGLDIGPARPLLSGRKPELAAFDFARDGRRILAAVPTSAAGVITLAVVQNWETAVEAR
jgi:serine/threonine-protein kinase